MEGLEKGGLELSRVLGGQATGSEVTCSSFQRGQGREMDVARYTTGREQNQTKPTTALVVSKGKKLFIGSEFGS